MNTHDAEHTDDDATATRRMPKLSKWSARVAVEARQIHATFLPVVEVGRNGRSAPFGHTAELRCDIPELSTPEALFRRAAAEDALGEAGHELRRVAVHSAPGSRLIVALDPAELDEPWLLRPDDPVFTYPDVVYLELRRANAIDSYRFGRATLDELESRGVKLAVRDFGGPDSALSTLIDISPRLVRLDRTLTDGLRRDTRRHDLVRSVVALATEQGADVLAEGIEDRDQLAAVVAAGVTLLQGPLLAPRQR